LKNAKKKTNSGLREYYKYLGEQRRKRVDRQEVSPSILEDTRYTEEYCEPRPQEHCTVLQTHGTRRGGIKELHGP